MAKVRKARAADATAIARVYIETWRSAYPGMLPKRVLIAMSVARQRAAWRHAIAAQRGSEAVLVAEEGGDRTIGFASCGRSRSRLHAYGGEIFTLYVLPDHQGRGHGRSLLRGCFGHLLAHRLGSALVWVLADNPSRFFYEAMGGRRVAEMTEPLWGARVPQIAYGWPDLTHAVAAGGPCADKVG
ncbi:MAG: GNAT family N-acetyltransferase [Kiloniellales bacterium]